MKRFFEIISLVFHPQLLPAYGFILLVNTDVFSLYPTLWKIAGFGGTLLFTGIIPTLPIFWMQSKGLISDINLSRREDRTIPYIIAFFSYLLWIVFLFRILQIHILLIAISMAILINVLIIILINTKWKISAHASGIGALTGAVFGLSYRMAINPVGILAVMLIFSALIALARLELKAHTKGQVVAGYVLSFVLLLITAIFY